jgi:hypothetical protein
MPALPFYFTAQDEGRRVMLGWVLNLGFAGGGVVGGRAVVLGKGGVISLIPPLLLILWRLYGYIEQSTTY